MNTEILNALIEKRRAESAPDVSALVEALEDIAQWSERWTSPGHPVATIARKALAVYRQGGGE